jgi:sugar (pentulose or hexulose) kinase
MKNCEVLAFDIGASSGRGILAAFDGKRIELRECGRFSNSFSILGGRAYWDLLRLLDNIKQGIAGCDAPIRSVAVDTWGVDFGLLDRAGALIGMPRSYRDDAFNKENMAEAITALGGEDWLFRQTWLCNMAINPLFQLYSMKKRGEGVLESAGTFLMIPNLIEYFLTGIRHSEYSIAATSQLYDMKHKRWAEPLLEKLGVPSGLFTAVDGAGKILGRFAPDVERETGKQVKVISVAGHDTASAVSAIPAGGEFMYLSSGTWSLMGFCSERLIEDKEILRRNISNEGTGDGAYRPNVNIIGLWILQECRKQWSAAGRDYTWEELNRMAEAARPLRSLIRPGDYEKIGDYPRMIREYCVKTGQPVPEETGALVRCILESLALTYRQVYDMFKPYARVRDAIHIVGGGVRNRLLNQFTANALNIPVITGPAEATAVGNVLSQLEALGELKVSERTGIIGNSFASEVFMPRDRDRWEESYARFLSLYD